MHESDEHEDRPEPGLSAEYRSVATETVPARLDRAILQMAEAELRASVQRAGWSGWSRPVAYIATLGLTLALVLQVGEPDLFSPPSDDAAPTQSASSLEEAAALALEQVRQVEADAAAMSASSPDNAATTGLDAPPEAVNSLQAGDSRCSDAQRKTTSNWWRCIEALEKRGQTHAAESELQDLLRTFPQFVVPD